MRWCIISVCVVLLQGCAHSDDGHLLVIGGGLRSDNAAIYEAFAELAGDHGQILILPTASGVPERAGQGTRDDLAQHVSEERLDVLMLTFTSTVHALIGKPGLQGRTTKSDKPDRALGGLFQLFAP